MKNLRPDRASTSGPWHRSFALSRHVMVLFVFTAALGASAFAMAPVSPASAATGGDWAGSSFCASYGVRPTGTSYNDVAACGNGYPNPGDPGQTISYNGVTFDTDGFQCVELAARYFYYVTGKAPPIVSYASDYAYYMGADDGYDVYPSGLTGVTSTFQSSLTAGNIISMWSNSDEVGHVAVVTNVAVTDGTGTITVMDENASASGTDTITVSGGTMSYEGIFPFFQWTTNLPNPSADPPTAIAHADGEQDVFWKGTNSQLEEEVWTPSAGFSAPFSLGMGPLGSSPTAVLQSGTNSPQYVFWEGTDSDIWEAYYTPASGWVGPIKIGMGPLGSAPVASMWGGQIELWWRGTDNNIWEAYSSGTPAATWYGPYRRTAAANVASQPAAIAHADGEQDVFWQSTNSQLEEMDWTPSAGFSAPFSLGMGPLGSSPTAALQSGTDSPQYVFWQGTDANIWEAYYTPARGWVGPTKVGMGPLGSSPAASMWSNQVELWWRGTDANLWEAYSSATPASVWDGPYRRTSGSPLS
jgi:surface antigen